MIEKIAQAGFLHDIGRAHLPKEINERSHMLVGQEQKDFEHHTEEGISLLEEAKVVPIEVRHMVYQHHERPDGTGFPHQLDNQKIYYPAKLITVVDSFSSLISLRPYRGKLSTIEAIAELERHPEQFDPEFVKVLKTIFGLGTKKAA
jgi:putative nucleotidyltransferase with HDIG domain